MDAEGRREKKGERKRETRRPNRKREEDEIRGERRNPGATLGIPLARFVRFGMGSG